MTDRGGIIYHGHGSITNQALKHLLVDHYLKRKPPMQDTFEWRKGNDVCAILVFGVPASRELQCGVCPTNPELVIELNRLWIADSEERGTASWFIAQCLREMQPHIIVAYADTTAGHDGTVYRAANFHYAGWTDDEDFQRVRRKPKARYWTVTGNKRDKSNLRDMCQWPTMNWKDEPVPTEHKRRKDHSAAEALKEG